MNTQKVLVSLGVLAVLFLGVQAFKSTSVVVNNDVPRAGSSTSNEHFGIEYFNGGMSGLQVPVTSTSTILCKAQNPTLATSTFRAAFRITVSTTSATVIGLATTTNALRDQATTTSSVSIGTDKTVGANVLGVSSYIGINEQNIIGPSEWVRYEYRAGTSPAGGMTANAQSGFCNFSFSAI